MDKQDLDMLKLFYRYKDWIHDNKLKDTLYNYTIYVTNIERLDFN